MLTESSLLDVQGDVVVTLCRSANRRSGVPVFDNNGRRSDVVRATCRKLKPLLTLRSSFDVTCTPLLPLRSGIL